MACSDTLCQYQSLTNRLRNCPPHFLKIPEFQKITARPFSKSHQNSLHVHLNHISFKIPARSPQKSSTLPSQSQQHSIKIPSKPQQHPINIHSNTSAFLQMSFIIAAQVPHKSCNILSKSPQFPFELSARFPPNSLKSLNIPSRFPQN